MTAESILLPLVGNWRWVVASYSVVAAGAGTAWWAIARRSPFGDETITSDTARNGPLLRERVVVAVLVLAVGTFFVGHALGGWLPDILRDGGWSEATAANVTALGVGAGLAGAMVLPMVAVGLRRRPMLAGLYVSMAGFIALVGTNSGIGRFVGVVGSGFVRVSLVPIVILILMDSPRVGPSRMGAAGGLLFTAGEIGGVLGPFTVGALRDSADDFGPALASLSVVAVALAVITLTAVPTRPHVPHMRG